MLTKDVTMRQSIYFSVLLGSICSLGFADAKGGTDKKKPCNPLVKPLSLNETFDNNGVNLGVKADLLYMVYNSPILTYASKIHDEDHDRHSTILNVPGHMNLGCNVALMYTMQNNPGYSFESSWFHIVPHFSRKKTANDILPAHSVSLLEPTPGSANMHAHVAINLFDLVIKKQFSFGDWFGVAPTAGVVGGFLNGKSHAHFSASSGEFASGVTDAVLAYTTKFEGIGLKIGADSSFKIGAGFSLRSELYYNMMYGLGRAHLNYSQNGLFSAPGGDTLDSANVHYSQHQGMSFFDSLLGLGWSGHFNNDSLFLDIHAGWRFQDFLGGWKEFEAEFNDSVLDHALQGQGLQTGITFRF